MDNSSNVGRAEKGQVRGEGLRWRQLCTCRRARVVFGLAFCAYFLVSIPSYAYPTQLFVGFSSGTSRCNEEACLFWRACVPYGESVTAYSDVFSYMCFLQREIRRISLQLNDNCVSLKVNTLQGRLTKLEQDCRSERVLSYGD